MLDLLSGSPHRWETILSSTTVVKSVVVRSGDIAIQAIQTPSVDVPLQGSWKYIMKVEKLHGVALKLILNICIFKREQ